MSEIPARREGEALTSADKVTIRELAVILGRALFFLKTRLYILTLWKGAGMGKYIFIFLFLTGFNLWADNSTGDLACSDISVAELLDVVRSNDSAFISISPNGKLALLESGIVVGIPSMEAVFRFSGGMEKMEYSNISWSPDSKHLAINESLFKNYDSDVWIIDIEKKKSLHLLDDNFSVCPSRKEGVGIYFEGAVSWSDDSTSLAFIRTEYSSRQNILVLMDNYLNEDIIQLYNIGGSAFSASWTRIFRVDGYVFYTYANIVNPGDSMNGIYRYNLEQNAVERIIDGAGEENRIHLMAVSQNGKYALATNLIHQESVAMHIFETGNGSFKSFPKDHESFYKLINLEDFSIQPLIVVPEGDPGIFLSSALFSANGSKIALVYRNVDKAYDRIAIIDIATGAEKVVFNQDYSEPYSFIAKRRLNGLQKLFWIDDTILYAITTEANELLRFELHK